MSSTDNASNTSSDSGGIKRPSTSFRDAVLRQAAPKTRRGENGTLEFTDDGVGNSIIAVSQVVRGGESQVRTLLGSALSSDKKENINEVLDTFLLMAATRNCRGGKGEKDLARQMWWALYESGYPETATAFLRLLVTHYGYWKDLWLLLHEAKERLEKSQQLEALQTACFSLVKEQWDKDIKAVQTWDRTRATTEGSENNSKGPDISLLAKWLPRENSSFDKRLKIVTALAQVLFPSDDNNGDAKHDSATKTDTAWQSQAKKLYRKAVARLSSYLDLPEVLLAAQREDEIKFGRIASKATLLLRKTFLNEQKSDKQRSRPDRVRLAERFRVHVLKKGLKGGQIDPHEIVEKILRSGSISEAEEQVLDAQWKDLWQKVLQDRSDISTEGDSDGESKKAMNLTRMIPMADVSGSMEGTPMHVSIALSIGLSEITHPAFRHMILTFETNPQWVTLDESMSIVEKVRKLERAPWGGSTNFEAAYKMILKVVEDNQLTVEDMPALVCFSDMQFDAARGMHSYGRSSDRRNPFTMFETMKALVTDLAARMRWPDSTSPTPIVFWNLRNTRGHPVDKDTPGTVLLSGFNPSLLKLVLTGGALDTDTVQVMHADGTVTEEKVQVTPEEVLRRMLDDSLYDPVRCLLSESKEGVLAEYMVDEDAMCIESDTETRKDADGDFTMV